MSVGSPDSNMDLGNTVTEVPVSRLHLIHGFSTESDDSTDEADLSVADPRSPSALGDLAGDM